MSSSSSVPFPFSCYICVWPRPQAIFGFVPRRFGLVRVLDLVLPGLVCVCVCDKGTRSLRNKHTGLTLRVFPFWYSSSFLSCGLLFCCCCCCCKEACGPQVNTPDGVGRGRVGSKTEEKGLIYIVHSPLSNGSKYEGC